MTSLKVAQATASARSMRWHQSSPAMIMVLVMCCSLSQTTAASQFRRPAANQRQNTHWCQEALRNETGSGVQEELHLRDLLVHILHELDNEVHQLVLQHLLGVEVGDEEGDIIALANNQQRAFL